VPPQYTTIPQCNLFIDFNSAAMAVKMERGPALQVFDIPIVLSLCSSYVSYIIANVVPYIIFIFRLRAESFHQN